MSSPTQLVITLTDKAVVMIPIAPALIGLDSGQQASEQTGFSATDISIRNIFRGGGFFDSVSKWYPVSQIAGITSQ